MSAPKTKKPRAQKNTKIPDSPKKAEVPKSTKLKAEIPSDVEPVSKVNKLSKKKIVYLFKAEVTKGHIPKTVFDGLAASLEMVNLRLSKDGILIRNSDCETNVKWARVLWNIEWPRKKFSNEYICKKPMEITLNVKHLQKMLKNVKRKESLTFFINKEEENLLGIIIKPINVSSGVASISETTYVSIKHVETTLPILPEVYLDENGVEKNAYGVPMVVDSAKFQKIKKMVGYVTSVLVTIQKSNYASFDAGDRTVMGTDLEFGQLLENPDDSQESGDNEKENSKSSLEEDTGEYPHIYSKYFIMSLIEPLIKLQSMTDNMEFYAPKVDNFPLKVTMSATSGLGDVSLYIKDEHQIKLDEDARREQ